MGTRPFNVLHMEVNKTSHNFGTQSLCTVSHIHFVYHLVSSVVVSHSYVLTFTPSIQKWRNTQAWTDREMDKLTTVTHLHMHSKDN